MSDLWLSFHRWSFFWKYADSTPSLEVIVSSRSELFSSSAAALPFGESFYVH